MLTLQVISIFLKPSLLSFVLVSIVAGVILGVHSWAYLASTPWLYDFFYSDYGIFTLAESSPAALGALEDSFWSKLSSESVYRLTVIVVAIVMGLAASSLVRILKYVFGTIYGDRPLDRDEKAERRFRLTMSFLAGCLWIGYVFVFLNFIQPMSLMLARIAMDNLNPWVGGLPWAASIFVLMLGLHIHVIFMRLVLLRSRVFGAQIEIQEALLG